MDYPNKGNVWVRAYMRTVADSYKDDDTGDVNATLLAEDACDQLDAYTDDDSIPERFFECAYDVAEECRKLIPRSFGRLINSVNSDFSINTER